MKLIRVKKKDDIYSRHISIEKSLPNVEKRVSQIKKALSQDEIDFNKVYQDAVALRLEADVIEEAAKELKQYFAKG